VVEWLRHKHLYVCVRNFLSEFEHFFEIRYGLGPFALGIRGGTYPVSQILVVLELQHSETCFRKLAPSFREARTVFRIGGRKYDGNIK
jgi:hypothetical protein